jgi:alkanesulfonate monooxygenase SsuD/methylene tetrahydromethanopterin reductase-like flavin-dependent oxidoreductase (luciferase family)
VVESWHGQTIDHPAAEMREYVGIVRAILRGEQPPAGAKWSTAFRLAGLDLRPGIPIFIAALSPAMLRLAGEIGDGVMLWLCHPGYIREVAVPAVREGRERAGKVLDGFEIVAAVPAISNEFLDVLTAVGDEQAVSGGVERYRDAGVTLPCLGPISRTDFEATLRAAAPG